ncbi:uncharacterized protein N7446_009295 [Penicillium canescens]|uniref:uncharacterized protein n=1 Tax=Penicillium canescens TaxID=5083 RepID=UPI0026E0E04A|nr:uncharacterized protein N7446_009295 [Penicillium canescens]KAJ6053283.1 hypothetical protein N7446_009295 [Penicillium canescens]
MSRRPPPRDYYDEEEMYEMERERERDHRPRRRDREYDDDIEYRRRRSDPPVEDLERLHLREADRPRRDFMEESFAHPSGRDDMMLRRSKEETVVLSPERRDHDEPYMPPSGSRLRNHPREIVDEDLIIEERERRRGSRRHPREVEDDLIVEERERHGDRSHRPGREVEDDLIVEERDMRREGRHRPDRVPAGDLIVEERDRRGDRRRRQKTEFEEDDLLVERERRRGGRRHPREIDEEGLIAEEKERRRERRPPQTANSKKIYASRKGNGAGRAGAIQNDVLKMIFFMRPRSAEAGAVQSAGLRTISLKREKYIGPARARGTPNAILKKT